MWIRPAALLAVLCVVDGAIAFPTELALDEKSEVLSLQRRIEYHPNSRKAMANAPKVSPDQIFVTLVFKSIARWPNEGHVENWVTIPLGKWLESAYVPSLPLRPISVAIINVRSKVPVRVSCQVALTVGQSSNPEKKSANLEWVPGVVSAGSRESFPDDMNLVGLGCH